MNLQYMEKDIACLRRRFNKKIGLYGKILDEILGMAIIIPRWMRYILDESTAERYYDYGVNVFGMEPSCPKMEAAEKDIRETENYF